MKRLSRRSFLAASAAMAAGPAFGAPRPRPAGARTGRTLGGRRCRDRRRRRRRHRGRAAARRARTALFVLLEAADQVGGRCITDNQTFGVPYDRGAHWIYTADINPVARLATQTGLEIYPAPPGQRMRIGRRLRARRRDGGLSRRRSCAPTPPSRTPPAQGDVACAQALPKDLGEWRLDDRLRARVRTAAARIFRRSRPSISPARSSATTAPSAARASARCWRSSRRPTCFSAATPVTRRSYGGAAVRSRSTRPRASFTARAVIVTVSTNVLTAGKIKFKPELPKRHLDAAGKLKLGSYDHVALELTGNPLGSAAR